MVTGVPSEFNPMVDGKGCCTQLNDPAGMATAVPITGPGHCAYPDILKRNDIAQINMLFILCFSVVVLVRL